jgi:hypothetical protein
LTPTLGDLTEDEPLKDAAAQLVAAQLAGTDEALAAWARRWGDGALSALAELQDRVCGLDADLEWED